MNSIHENFRFECGCCIGINNYANNLKELLYNYWLAKSKIVEDKTNELKYIWDTLNFKVMECGLIPVILDYGKGLTISHVTDLRLDKNSQPLVAWVQVNLINGGTKDLRVIDWKLDLPENEELKAAYFQQLGWDDKTVYYKAIFFRNNYRGSPTLYNLSKIIANIHDLDKKADKDRDFLNVKYQGKSNKKFTPEQLRNFGIQISDDKLGVMVTTFEDENIGNLDVKKDIITQSISNWEIIDSQLEKYEKAFSKFGGINDNSLTKDRENQLETASRTETLNNIEQGHFKYRQEFIDELNEALKLDIKISFSESIKLENLETKNKVIQQQIGEENND